MDGRPEMTVGVPSGALRPRVGIVGAGKVGTALGVAIDRAGWPVAGVTSRDAGRRSRFRGLVPGAREVTDLAELVDLVDVIFLTVPDDAIGTVAAGVRLRAGQALVHTSGALPASILRPAQAGGTTAASFHPLVPFTGTTRAVEALAGATIAIEGDPSLVAILTALATDLGARPIVVSADGKAAYHAAAVLAAGGFVALLDAIAELALGAGLDEMAAMATYGPLVREGLANAAAAGIGAALTGPFVRGDVRTVQLHLEAIDRLAQGTRDLYAATAERQIAIALARGDLAEDRVAALQDLLRQEQTAPHHPTG